MQEGKKIFLDMSGDGVVVPLEDGGEDAVGGFLDGVDLFDFGGWEVGETELWMMKSVFRAEEARFMWGTYALEFSSGVELLDCFQALFNGSRWIRTMEVVDINLF